MFKVIDLPPEGKPIESVGTDSVSPAPEGWVRWIDLVETDDEALDLLGNRFGFHPLALEDCASFEMHSKLEEYDDFLFVVLHTFTADPDHPADIQVHEVHAFLTDRTLVTVHDNPVPAQQRAWQAALRDRRVLSRGPCWALYMTADIMVDQIFPLLTHIGEELEEVEEGLLSGGEDRDLMQIFQMKRTLVSMRRVIRPLRDVVRILSRRGDPRVRERTAVYFRDIHDHTLRCAETIEEDLALASNAMDAYHTTISNKTNDVMRKLTIVSAVFLPLTFLTGFWGQNFDSLPIHEDVMFYSQMALMVALPVGLVAWFWKKGLL